MKFNKENLELEIKKIKKFGKIQTILYVEKSLLFDALEITRSILKFSKSFKQEEPQYFSQNYHKLSVRISEKSGWRLEQIK